MNNFQKSYSVGGQHVWLVNGGYEFFDILIRLIREAKFEIHVQTYIFENDETGKLVLGELISAAARGVKIFLLMDDFGSAGFHAVDKEQLSAVGIEWRFFGSYRHFSNLYWGRRLHHKVVVIDNKRTLVGGINISDHYSGLGEKKAWLDFAVLMEGDISFEAAAICRKLWHRKSKNAIAKIPAARNKKQIYLLQHDYFRRKRNIHQDYLKAIRESKKEIIIFASYFMPGRRLRLALSKAAERGIVIKLIVQGASDVWIAKYATEFFYRFCHRNNIEVYEWTASILHAKVAVVDNSWMTVGSYNLNHLSAYASVELNIGVRDNKLVSEFHDLLLKALHTGAVSIDPRKSKFAFLKNLRNMTAFTMLRWGFRCLYLLLLTHKRFLRFHK